MPLPVKLMAKQKKPATIGVAGENLPPKPAAARAPGMLPAAPAAPVAPIRPATAPLLDLPTGPLAPTGLPTPPPPAPAPFTAPLAPRVDNQAVTNDAFAQGQSEARRRMGPPLGRVPDYPTVGPLPIETSIAGRAGEGVYENAAGQAPRRLPALPPASTKPQFSWAESSPGWSPGTAVGPPAGSASGASPYANKFTNLAAATAGGYPAGTPEAADYDKQRKLLGESDRRVEASGYWRPDSIVQNQDGTTTETSPMTRAKERLESYRGDMREKRQKRRLAIEAGTDTRHNAVVEAAKGQAQGRRARLEQRRNNTVPRPMSMEDQMANRNPEFALRLRAQRELSQNAEANRQHDLTLQQGQQDFVQRQTDAARLADAPKTAAELQALQTNNDLLKRGGERATSPLGDLESMLQAPGMAGTQEAAQASRDLSDMRKRIRAGELDEFGRPRTAPTAPAAGAAGGGPGGPVPPTPQTVPGPQPAVAASTLLGYENPENTRLASVLNLPKIGNAIDVDNLNPETVTRSLSNFKSAEIPTDQDLDQVMPYLREDVELTRPLSESLSDFNMRKLIADSAKLSEGVSEADSKERVRASLQFVKKLRNKMNTDWWTKAEPARRQQAAEQLRKNAPVVNGYRLVFDGPTGIGPIKNYRWEKVE